MDFNTKLNNRLNRHHSRKPRSPLGKGIDFALFILVVCLFVGNWIFPKLKGPTPPQGPGPFFPKLERSARKEAWKELQKDLQKEAQKEAQKKAQRETGKKAKTGQPSSARTEATTEQEDLLRTEATTELETSLPSETLLDKETITEEDLADLGWNRGTFPDRLASLEYHYKKHHEELPVTNIPAYLEAAVACRQDVNDHPEDFRASPSSGELEATKYKNRKDRRFIILTVPDQEILSFGR